MIYIKKNNQNQIIDIRFSETEGYEQIQPMDPDFSKYLKNTPHYELLIHQVLTELDQEMVRTIEDIIDLLIKKKIILFTDLPEIVQNKILFKKHIRKSLHNHTSIIDEEELNL